MFIRAYRFQFIVGYANKNTAASGFAMLGAQFETVSANDGSATLADLTIGGYEKYDEETDEGGTSGDFDVQFLTASGTLESGYSWYDDDVRTGWFDRDDKPADNVKLDAAKGIWVRGGGLTMTSAGQVNENDIVITTASSGFRPVANTFPVDVKLSQLAVTGYDAYDEETDEGGTSGDFDIQFLTANGKLAAGYSWYDDDERTGWYDRDDNLSNNVVIPAGTGVWVRGGGLTIRIPAPELN